MNISVNVILGTKKVHLTYHQSKNNPHILQEISTNILTKMSDTTGSPHWACSEKCKQKKLVTENSVSAVWYKYVLDMCRDSALIKFELFYQWWAAHWNIKLGRKNIASTTSTIHFLK